MALAGHLKFARMDQFVRRALDAKGGPGAGGWPRDRLRRTRPLPFAKTCSCPPLRDCCQRAVGRRVGGCRVGLRLRSGSEALRLLSERGAIALDPLRWP